MSDELTQVHNYHRNLLHTAQMCAVPNLQRGQVQQFGPYCNHEWLRDVLREATCLTNSPAFHGRDTFYYRMADWCMRQLVYTLRMAEGQGISIGEAPAKCAPQVAFLQSVFHRSHVLQLMPVRSTRGPSLSRRMWRARPSTRLCRTIGRP